MARQLKTQKNDGNVLEFLQSVENVKRREDGLRVLEIMCEVTGEKPEMWGSSIVGFGRYTQTYANGKTNEWFHSGFSPRKQAMTLYIMSGFSNYDELLGRLGKYKTGKACLYIKKLEDVDLDVLKELIKASADHMTQMNND